MSACGGPERTVITSPRHQPTPPRLARPARCMTGMSRRPDQKKRWKAMSAGVRPTVMPCLAATKPAAQQNAAPMPQSAPTSRTDKRDWAVAFTNDSQTADKLGLRPKSNRGQQASPYRDGMLMAKSRKVIITCAVTGSIHTPSMSPHLPVTSQEIADAAIGAAEAGAAIVHLHARNPQDGRPDQTP